MSSLQNRSTGMNHPNPPVGLRTKQGAYPNHILEQPLYSRPGSLFNRLEIRALFPWGDGRWLPNHGPSLPRAAPSMLACVVLPRSLLLPTDRRARPGDVRRWTDPGRPMHQRTAEMRSKSDPPLRPFPVWLHPPYGPAHLGKLDTHTRTPSLSRIFFSRLWPGCQRRRWAPLPPQCHIYDHACLLALGICGYSPLLGHSLWLILRWREPSSSNKSCTFLHPTPSKNTFIFSGRVCTCSSGTLFWNFFSMSSGRRSEELVLACCISFYGKCSTMQHDLY